MSNIVNENQNNTGSVILNLEKISTEYNNVLTQYNQARSNYINYLNTKSETVDASGSSLDASGNNLNQYLVLTNTFYGQSTLTNPIQTNNIDICKNKCSANSSCTGANFLQGSTCLLMKDVNGELSPKQESSAIVPPEVYYLTTLKQLNVQLMNLNDKLTKQINKGQPIFEKQTEERAKQSEALDKNYKSLISEREKIEKQLKQFDDVNEAQINSTLIVDKNYAIYKYLIGAFIIIVLIIMSLPTNVSNQITEQLPQMPQIPNQIGGKLVDNEYKNLIVGGVILIVFIIYFYY
jgi:hypothetical protein